MWSLLPVLLWVPFSHADLIMEPPDGTQHLRHTLEVKGLPAGRVLVFAADGKEIPGVVAFEADGERELGSGHSRFHILGSKPRLWSLTTADYAAWKQQAATLTAEQEAACADRGEGCVHISRFQPRLPPPSPAVSCGQPVRLRLEGPADGPSTTRDVLTVQSLTATECAVSVVAAPSAPSAGTPPRSPRCSTGFVGTSLLSLLVGVVLVLTQRRGPPAAALRRGD